MTELKTLPRLKIVRDTYITQEMVDAACDYLEKGHPDVLKDLIIAEEPRHADYHDHHRRIRNRLAKAPEGLLRLPSTLFEKLDFSFELSRRARRARGLPDVEVQGHPLAPSIDGPYPPLVHLPIEDKTKEYDITQEIADDVIAEAYARNPAVWFIAGEEFRYRVGVGQEKGVASLIYEVFLEKYHDLAWIPPGTTLKGVWNDKYNRRIALFREADRYLATMCNFKLP